MPTDAAHQRGGLRTIPRHLDTYVVGMLTAAAAVLVVWAVTALAGTQWLFGLLEMPAFPFQMGGLAGAIALCVEPSSIRRLGSRAGHSRIAGVILYRLLVAAVLGVLGFMLLRRVGGMLGLTFPRAFYYVVSAACGASERLLNNMFLASVGAMAPKGIDPRLL